MSRWLLMALLMAGAAKAQERPRVTVEAGVLEGAADPSVRRFLGVPFAAAPVGRLRWRPPEPAARWRGVRRADAFGARCMQEPLFSDMAFRSPPSSEDCLYLNIWTPADARPGAKLPVLFYVYGGGFQAGDASEKRYDGAALAARGMIVVTANHRLNVFGFLAHPGLTAESPRRASGNYGLLDQAATVGWIRRNIARFGGDPARITVGGESAGSMSVSALMASPLTRGGIAGAIGQSGALMGALSPMRLADAERQGEAFARALGVPDLAGLRALPAERLLAAQGRPGGRFGAVIDGHMLAEPPAATFAAGRQARVPLLAGTNSQEAGYQAVLGESAPTAANYRTALVRMYGDRAGRVEALYPAATDAEVIPAATALASDRFLTAATWTWADLHRRSGAPTYVYLYTRVRPARLDAPAPAPTPWGAVHSAEIEYALGNLDVNPAYAWAPEDRQVSATMGGYWANFVRTGDPNGAGLPPWPRAVAGAEPVQRQVIDVRSGAVPFVEQPRYRQMDALTARQ
jgi:para-nitrobenzyl esterase